MTLKTSLLSGIAVTALSSCVAPGQPVGDEGRVIKGVAPAGTARVLVIDADGRAFDAVPAADGAFAVAIASSLPVSLFVTGADVRVLRVAASPGGAPTLTALPDWNGTVDTAQLSTAAEPDGAGAEQNPLEQIDSDDDGASDLEDSDDDDDGLADDVDDDDDGSGADDDDEDLDTDDDGSPDSCDDDDDDDGVRDEDDEDEADDSDGDGIDDADDADDDNDCDADDEDDDDDDDGVDDADDEDDGGATGGTPG